MHCYILDHSLLEFDYLGTSHAGTLGRVNEVLTTTVHLRAFG